MQPFGKPRPTSSGLQRSLVVLDPEDPGLSVLSAVSGHGVERWIPQRWRSSRTRSGHRGMRGEEDCSGPHVGGGLRTIIYEMPSSYVCTIVIRYLRHMHTREESPHVGVNLVSAVSPSARFRPGGHHEGIFPPHPRRVYHFRRLDPRAPIRGTRRVSLCSQLNPEPADPALVASADLVRMSESVALSGVKNKRRSAASLRAAIADYLISTS